MKTLQEKYNAILEGNFSKKQFVRDARLALPNLITQFNGYEDTVSILKNKGMLHENKKSEVTHYDKPEPGYSIETLERGVDYELEGMGLMSQETVSEEDYVKAKKKAEKNLEKNPNHYLDLLAGESTNVDKHDKYVEVKKDNHVDTFNGMKKAELKESIIERAMAKGYTKEQVEEALKKLKEKKGKDHDGDGDIDSDDYLAAKDKAIKKSMGKDVNEGRRRKMKGGKVVTENDYDTGGYVEAMGPRLEKALKHLIQMWEEWKEGPLTEPGMVSHAKKDLINYITNQLAEQEEEIVSEEDVNEQFFDDLEDAKNFARKESEEGYVQHVNKHPKGGFRVEDWLDGSNTVASYQGGEYLQESQLKEAVKNIITNILSEEKILTEAATGNLSKLADQYDDFEGMQSIINSLENIVTDVESYFAKTREKIQTILNTTKDIKNPDGLNIGAFIAPTIKSAFLKDLKPVREKGLTKGINLPKVQMVNPNDIQDLDEKQTVFSPVNESRKTKYTKRRK